MCCKCFCRPCAASQRSLHNEPIFRLLLKVAVKGTQQCDFLNFCGVYSPIVWMIIICIYVQLWCRILCKSFLYVFHIATMSLQEKTMKCKQNNGKGKNFNTKIAFCISVASKKFRQRRCLRQGENFNTEISTKVLKICPSCKKCPYLILLLVTAFPAT